MAGNLDCTLKWQRYEAKYLVSEAQANEIRRWCRDYLPPDPHASLEAGFVYPITSVYLDSASRLLLQHTVEGRTNRYKLRVRAYRECHAISNALPLYIEVKRKISGVVHKTRARLHPQDGDELLWNGQDVLAGPSRYDRVTEANLHEFQHLRRQIGAQPILGVSYTREAYEGVSADRIRVTLDRDLHYGTLARPDEGGRGMWWPINPGGVILEVKFTNVYPFWIRNMLHRLEVVRRGVCKYVVCSRGARSMIRAT